MMVPKEDYESLLETLELISVPGFRQSLSQSSKDIEEGDLFSIDDIFDS